MNLTEEKKGAKLMYISEKYKRLEAALNAAYIQDDDAAIDAIYASMDKLRCVMEKMVEEAEVVHYDFCTTKYRGNAAFYGGELISAYLRENDDPALATPRIVDGRRILGIGGAILLSWSLEEDYSRTDFTSGILVDAVGRYARMYGKRRLTKGDLPMYIPEDMRYYPRAILNAELAEEVDE